MNSSGMHWLTKQISSFQQATTTHGSELEKTKVCKDWDSFADGVYRYCSFLPTYINCTNLSLGNEAMMTMLTMAECGA